MWNFTVWNFTPSLAFLSAVSRNSIATDQPLLESMFPLNKQTIQIIAVEVMISAYIIFQLYLIHSKNAYDPPTPCEQHCMLWCKKTYVLKAEQKQNWCIKRSYSLKIHMFLLAKWFLREDDRLEQCREGGKKGVLIMVRIKELYNNCSPSRHIYCTGSL